jgi:hypothetical protein
LRELRRVVAPSGLLLGSVYSLFGRWDDRAIRELLDRAVEDDQFELRHELLGAMELGSKHRLAGFLSQATRRFRYGPPVVFSELARVYFKRDQLTHSADTYSNPCEHLYRFDELAAMLESTGWELLGLAPGAGLPTSIDEHTRDDKQRRALAAIPEPVLFDYFAYRHRTWLFTVVARPTVENAGDEPR